MSSNQANSPPLVKADSRVAAPLYGLARLWLEKTREANLRTDPPEPTEGATVTPEPREGATVYN